MYKRYLISQLKNNGFFLMGLVAGLYLAIACVPYEDESHCLELVTGKAEEIVVENLQTQPPGPAPAAPVHPLQRPRYYSTELGIREKLFAAVLSSEQAVSTRGVAINSTVSGVIPALKFFMTASAPGVEQLHTNVVGFTDTREMLKPFHMIKYIADNYLEEYDYFFLVGDMSFVNARRLINLAESISVSEDVYLGITADDHSDFCSLDKGVLISNSVLRRVHSSLDWCVKNSYSAQHHENIGRCILHSTDLKCTQSIQGQEYTSISVHENPQNGLWKVEAMADAVTAYPVSETDTIYQMQAYVARILLERDQKEIWQLRRTLVELLPRHPVHYRNSSWPGGLRNDAGMDPPTPENRFDHLRWTWFNESHAMMLDDLTAVSPLPDAHQDAVQYVLRHAWSWSKKQWPTLTEAGLVEGLWKWDPARSMSYRLLLRFKNEQDRYTMRLLEVCRPLGAARLVSVPYVTESTRLSLILPLDVDTSDSNDKAEYLAFLKRYEAVCLQQDRKTSLTIVMYGSNFNNTLEDVKRAAAALGLKYREADVHLQSHDGGASEALRWAVARLPRDALVLVAHFLMEFNQDFLNRARMNTISGVQWFSPMPFWRYAQFDHPRFVDANGNKPQSNTGRFHPHHTHIVSFYRTDYEAALEAAPAEATPSPAEALGAGALHVIRAPEPGLVLRPGGAPCRVLAGRDAACLARLEREHFQGLNLGNKMALAKMLLETGVVP